MRIASSITNILSLRTSFLFAQTKSNPFPLSLAHPYEYTLHQQQFALHDIRFTEMPMSRPLGPKEQEHMGRVLDYFTGVVEGRENRAAEKEFVKGRLLEKGRQLPNWLQQGGIELSLEIDKSSMVNVVGCLQIYGEGVSLEEADIEPIHHYSLIRDHLELHVYPRQSLKKSTSQEQLKEDINKSMNEKADQMKDALDKLKEQSQANGLPDRIMRGLLSLGQRKKVSSAFKKHWLVQQVKGTMTATMHKPQSHSQVMSFDSKWAYWVPQLEPQHLKAQRKHILMDFQWWNRGSLFPVHSFAAEHQ